MTTDQRLVDIEKKAAFQEHLLAQLNEALVGQQKQLAVLEARLKAMSEGLDRGDLVKRREDENPPPHY
jgi:SlyX protein